MDLKDILGQGSLAGNDGQGGAGNKRPKTREQGGPKGLSSEHLPPLKPPSYAKMLDSSIEKDSPIVLPRSKTKKGILKETRVPPFSDIDLGKKLSPIVLSPQAVPEGSYRKRDSTNMDVHADFIFPAQPHNLPQSTPKNMFLFPPTFQKEGVDSPGVSFKEDERTPEGKLGTNSQNSQSNVKIELRPEIKAKGKSTAGKSSNPFTELLRSIGVGDNKSSNEDKELKLKEKATPTNAEGIAPKDNIFARFATLKPGGNLSTPSLIQNRRGSGTQPTFMAIVKQETKAAQDANDLVAFNLVLEFLLHPDVYKLISNSQTKLFLSHRLDMSEEKASTASKNPSQIFHSRENVEYEREPFSLKHRSSSKGIVDAHREKHRKSNHGKIQPKRTNEKEKTLEGNEVTFRHIIEYLPIAVFLAAVQKKPDWDSKLVEIYRKMYKEDKAFESETMYEDQIFLITLIRRMINLDEHIIFTQFITTYPDLNALVTQKIMEEIVITNGKHDYPAIFYKAYFDKVAKKKISKEDFHAILSNEVTIQSNETVPFEPILSRAKVILLCKNYFVHNNDNRQILEILRHMGITKKNLVDLLMEIKDEDRMITILNKHIELMDYVSVQELLRYKTYGPLVLFDSMELINIFNMGVLQSKNYTLYQKLCDMIGNGQKVESLCNIINHVSSTFWDMPKLRRFFESLRKTLSGKNNNWLIHIQNPLLFCMTLVYFFKKMRAQLDYNDKDIISLSNDMLKFCQIYVESASHEALNINLFDKDSYGMGFLDYAFLVKEMNILETVQIEGLIYEMWDLNRHTMQTLSEFMRVIILKEKLKRFALDFFKLDYSMPIEEGDTFQLDFCYASNSVQLKVMSELFWPLTVIVLELIFSLHITDMRLNEEFNSKWFSLYISRKPIFVITSFAVRICYTLSMLIKTLAIKNMVSETHYMQACFNFSLILSFFQLVIYPLFLWDFWSLSISQMFYTLSIIVYVLMNALSLNEVGVLLRIFFRMALVVVIFGTVSFTYITVIAYTIHVIFTGFSQTAEGQIFSDFNLFNNLYQGIMTLFEFVFGAVVLVRPYTEQNLYTYAMTFVMTMFSFFGNIMMANMLVAFLTSQFDHITTNAKYLTMNMQYGLIRVFGSTDMDTLISMPYILVLPSLPFYLLFLLGNDMRRKTNLFLRKAIHLLNVFLPTFFFTTIKILVYVPIRYVEQSVRLFIRIPFSKIGIVHWLVWSVAGPFLLLKLFCLDLATICGITLNFSEDGSELLDFELKSETRNNLVKAFSKMSKTMVSFIQRSYEKVTVKEFLDNTKAVSMQELLVRHISKIATHNNAESLNHQRSTVHTDLHLQESILSSEKNFNAKYLHDIRLLVPILLKKYADYNGRSPSPDDMRIDLLFMNDKFKNNVNPENVGRLVAFEKNTLDFSSRAFHQEDPAQEVEREFQLVHSQIDDTDVRIKKVLEDVLRVKAHLKK